MQKLILTFLAVAVAVAVFGQGLVRYYGPPPVQQANAAPAPAAATARPSGPQAISLAADATGHFVTDIRINGGFIKGMVDTGATLIALPLAEARKIGINPPASSFTSPLRTANGEVKAARLRLQEVRVGTIVVNDIDAVIVPSGLDTTLIGMSFFNRLSSFEMRGKTLVLRQ